MLLDVWMETAMRILVFSDVCWGTFCQVRNGELGVFLMFERTTRLELVLFGAGIVLLFSSG